MTINGVIDSDYNALVALYNSTNGANWTNKTNWLTSADVLTWHGVTVSGDRVVSISLPSNNLVGNIPTQLGNLANLSSLDLAYNQISGGIPVELANLANLSSLRLAYNQISGGIPVELANLANLYFLRLDNNQLSGEIPVELGNLANLSYLNLDNNQLSGEIPSELGNLTKLSILTLVNNKLSGSIPSQLGNLPNLQYLYLNNNQLSGSIPSQLGNLSNLQRLYLHNNQISGTIPSEIGEIQSLQYLWLYNNLLGGTIPTTITNRTWTFLNLENPPYVVAEIPDQNLTSGQLFTLNISSNFRDLNNDTITYSANNLPNGLTLNPNTGVISGKINSTGNFNVTITGTDNDGKVSDTFALIVPNQAPVITSSNFSVAENLSQVGTIQATDADGNTLTYSISGGLDSSLFQINSNTGLLSFKTAPDYENPADSNADNLYQVQVTANDGSLNSQPALINVSVTNVNDLINGVVESDYNALVALYNSTNGANWYDKTNWLTSADVSTWYGVTVSGDRVVGINLSFNILVGNIPTELGNLTNLSSLSLSVNQLTGEIPSELGNLANLSVLSLSGNQLSGEIPSELGNLANLSSLNLFFNQLSGEIPVELGNLTNLSSLVLSNNQLSGEIPVELANLPSLDFLSLYANQLSGEIPVELANLPSLQWLDLGYNQLSGEIPVELANLANLYRLTLDNNQLSGEIPVELANLTNLKYLWLDNNQLTGEIPSELGNLTNLEYLYLAGNQLSGEIPLLLGDNLNLQYLRLQNNRLIGTVPNNITNRTWTELNLENPPYVVTEIADQNVVSGDQFTLNISNNFGDLNQDTITYSSNNLPNGLTLNPNTGVISGTSNATGNFEVTITGTDNDGNISDTFVLTLGNGLINGVVADDYNALVALYNSTNGANWKTKTNWLTSADVRTWHGVTVLGDRVVSISLDNNNLVGNIPTELGNLANLQYLYLYNNQLTGEIPSELGNLANLQYLWLDGNQLSGSIPTQLVNLTNLKYLSLSFNQLSGSIPPELGNLTNLQGLYLYNNQLSGSIPPELGNLANLQSLLLDSNQLSGSIPTQLVNLSNLKYLWLDSNQLSGSIPSELGNLTNLEGLHLYNNQLSGSIPTQLGNLANLEGLHLYNNQLSGSIPTQLGNLTNLSSLYLGNNQLSGSIPTQLGNLPNLKYLSFVNNQLSGSIPSELGNLTNLRGLYLNNNQLSGSIPTQLGNLLNLQGLYLYNNQLSGSIPTQLGEIQSLRYLWLNNNLLGGTIPDNITNRTWSSLNLENPPYVVTEIADQNVVSGDQFTLNISNNFGDLNQDTITYSSNNLPNGLTLNPNTGVISGTSNVTGNFEVTITGTDNDGKVSDTFALIVVNPNQAPVITSSNFSVAENLTQVGTIQATDADGNTLTYSISGGLDSSLFQINSNTGLLSFISAPDYENPADSNLDNLYQVQITANDGSLNSQPALINVSVTNVSPETIIGTDGNDSLTGTSADELIEGLGGQDTLKSGAGNDTIRGGAGNDQIYGNAGSDLLEGGAGSDRYFVDANDTVNDSGGTQDLVYASINLNLANYTGIENLTLQGNANLNGTGDGNANKIIGNNGNNILIGNNGNDQIQGKNGNDTLIGGQGNDTLVGGSGLDSFQFNNPSEGIDRITDFNVLEDSILVSANGFGGGLVANSTITSAQFVLGTSATTSAHRFIYNASQGTLAFDADGVGGSAGIQLAKLSNLPANFSQADIVVI